MKLQAIFLILVISSCKAPEKSEWKLLFNNKDLSGWDKYLGPTYDTALHKFDSLNIPGLNNDQENVFSVTEVDGKPAIRISGQYFGGINTLEEFSNYHLQLQFKWGVDKWPPNHKQERKRDSGLLYHAVGPHGADNGFWMRSQEFQIQETDCGDYWGVAGGIMDIPAEGPDVGKFVYDPSKPLTTFSGTSVNGRRCIKNPDAEKPTGEWNTLDLYCLGDSAAHVVNGKLVMLLYHSRQADGDREMPLTRGKVQLQSEGAEVFFRDIKIEKIKAWPSYL